MINMRRPTLAVPLAAITAALLDIATPNPAHAQMILEEVIVTARKRTETLQETPIAVTALGADELRAAQIANIGDLTRAAPGLTRREGTKRASLAIRGIGTRNTTSAVEPGVGVYIDEIYIPRNDTQLADVLNMKSVQVLRGPQGTLFGKNTIGGALLLETKKPDTDLVEGFAEGSVGNLDHQHLRAGVSGPLIEKKLAGGIMVDWNQRDGYREDARTGEEFGDLDRQAMMAQLRYAGDEVFTGDLLLFYGEVDENSEPRNCLRVADTTLQTFIGPGTTDSYAETCAASWAALDDEEVIMDTNPPRYSVTNEMAGLTLSWDLSDVTVKSITGYLHQDDLITSQDVDATDVFVTQNQDYPRDQLAANGLPADDEERTFVSQELQLLGSAFDDFLDYTVGLFYSSEEIKDDAGGSIIGAGGFVGRVSPTGTVSVFPPTIGFREARVRKFENESAAIYSQAILNLYETWQLTLGGRYTWEEKEASQVNYLTTATSPGAISRDEFDALVDFIHPLALNPDNPNPANKDDWTEFDPAATLTFFTPDRWHSDSFDGGILYLSVSEGFKAGGFSPFGEELQPFDPESVLTTELGYKLDFLSSKLRLNGAFYYSEYDDIQLNVTRTMAVDNPELPTIQQAVITNAGQATIWGGELELSMLPVEGLFVGINASYTDASYDDFIDEDSDGNPVDRSDEDFAYIPEWTLSLTLQYEWMTDLGSITPRLSGLYRDDLFIGLDPASAETPEAYLDDFTTWNFRLAWQAARWEGLEVAGYVNNLADEEYFGSGIASVQGVGALSLVPGLQRTYGVEVLYAW